MESGEAEGLEGLEGGCRVGWGSDGRNAGPYRMNGIRRGSDGRKAGPQKMNGIRRARGPGRRLQGRLGE